MKLNATTLRWLHNERYINFKHADQCESKVLHKKEFYETTKEVAASCTQIEHTTVRRKFLKNNYALCETGDYLRLTWRDKQGIHQRYTNFRDDKRNDSDKKKGQVITEVKSDFKQRTGTSFNDAFGTTPQYFKRCVPGLFHYDAYGDGKVRKMCKVTKYDFTSFFASCAQGTLPDANSQVLKEGVVKPTAEYPFAFYVRSGFVAEYGKYDTREWYNTDFGEVFFKSPSRKYTVNPSPEEGETTILMKASTQTLDPEMMAYYEAKANAPKDSDERKEAKEVLLKLVGQFEQNDLKRYLSNPYAHLAAVIKARAVWRMLTLINKIGKDNVLQVIVDGILWQNLENRHFEDKEEFLGSLKLEATNAVCTFKGHNQYVLKKPDGTYDISHQGYDVNVDDIDITHWERSKHISLRESIRNLGVNIEQLTPWFDEKDFFEAVREGLV